MIHAIKIPGTELFKKKIKKSPETMDMGNSRLHTRTTNPYIKFISLPILPPGKEDPLAKTVRSVIGHSNRALTREETAQAPETINE